MSGEIELLLQLLPHRHAVGGAHHTRRVGALFPDLLTLSLLLRVLLEQCVLVLMQHGVVRDELFDCGIIDLVRVQLLIDPVVETDRAHLECVTRLGAERQATERVDDLLIGGQLADIGADDRSLGLAFPGARALCGYADRRDADQRRGDACQFCDSHVHPLYALKSRRTRGPMC